MRKITFSPPPAPSEWLFSKECSTGKKTCFIFHKDKKGEVMGLSMKAQERGIFSPTQQPPQYIKGAFLPPPPPPSHCLSLSPHSFVLSFFLTFYSPCFILHQYLGTMCLPIVHEVYLRFLSPLISSQWSRGGEERNFKAHDRRLDSSFSFEILPVRIQQRGLCNFLSRSSHFREVINYPKGETLMLERSACSPSSTLRSGVFLS